MVNVRSVYIMVSRTDTRIARMIRAATHYPYNHVSVTLDPALDRWYSFARYHRDAPLYGGFVAETPARLLSGQGDAPVRVFRVDIPERAAAALEAMLREKHAVGEITTGYVGPVIGAHTGPGVLVLFFLGKNR